MSGTEHVLNTAELGRRPSRSPDHEAESRALATLAQELATNPDGVLQTLVKLVLELCRADSASVSIFEPGGENGTVRWHAAAGAIAAHLDGTMPREAGPDGAMIARAGVLLFHEADRVFPALREVEPRICENLLAPWHADGKPAGILWAIKHTPEGQFDAEDARLLERLATFAAAAWQTVSALREIEVGRREFAARTRELRESEERQRQLAASYELERSRLEAVLQNLPVGVWIADQHGRLVGKNSQADRIWGGDAPLLESQEEYGRYSAWDATSGRELVADEYPVARALATGRPVEPIELKIRRFDGTEGIVLVSAAPVLDREGRPSGAVGINLDVTQWAAMKAELRASEEELRLITDNTPALIGSIDREGRYRFVNETACRFFGRPREEILGRTMVEVVGERVYERLRPGIEAALRGETARFDDVEPDKHGPGFHGITEEHYVPRVGADGSIEGYSFLAVDVSEQRRIEQALRRSEERFRTLFESIDEGFCVIEVLFNEEGTAVDYRFEQVNPAFERQTGLHDAVGKTARELVPDLEEHWFQTYGEVARTGIPTRFVQEAQPMDHRWFDVYAFRLGEAESRRVAILFTDITERKRVEADIARLAAIVESSHDAIYRCQLDGTIVDWNRGAEELYGYTAAEIVGRDVAVLAPPEQTHEQVEFLRRLERGDDIPPLETVRRRKDGTLVEVELRPSAVRDSVGHMVGIGVIARDVSARKRLERAQEDFLAMASHDLKSPVTVLRGRAQLMRRRKRYDEATVDAILEQTRRIERLVTDLQEVVHLEAGTITLRRMPT
ncbi:MAG: PAS domain S-box protein, partial [Chloroflexota bacterium]|nr:PAS domain S-box protein [Chloroflexota bacterium]